MKQMSKLINLQMTVKLSNSNPAAQSNCYFSHLKFFMCAGKTFASKCTIFSDDSRVNITDVCVTSNKVALIRHNVSVRAYVL